MDIETEYAPIPVAARPSLLTGLFRAEMDAERAIGWLSRRGYTTEEVSVLMSEGTRRRFAAKLASPHAWPGQPPAELAIKGLGVGSAVGGLAGALFGGLIAVAAPLLSPGLALMISGPLVVALAGVGAGGLAGGLIGGLVAAGVPEKHARVYDVGLREGAVLLTVQPRDPTDAGAISSEWMGLHAESVRA